MKQLWSPWRNRYVSSAAEATECVFCAALARRHEPESLIVHEGEHDFVILNLYPYNAGHLMIAPYDHVATLADARPEALAEMMGQLQLAEKVLQIRYRPRGLNLGMNLGRVSGAGVADHIHMHVVPRWEGDTNFMTVLNGVRVISEDFRETARELRQLFREHAGS